MKAFGWLAVIVVAGLLYLIATDDPSPPTGPVPTPTVTVTTALPTVEVTIDDLPDVCRDALANAVRVDEAVREYEGELSKLGPIQADTAKAIATRDLDLLNAATEAYMEYENESALGIETLMLAISDLEASIPRCQEEIIQ